MINDFTKCPKCKYVNIVVEEINKDKKFCKICERAMINSIGEGIKNIPKDKTLKGLVEYYGEDMPVGVLIMSHLTPHEQRFLGLIGK